MYVKWSYLFKKSCLWLRPIISFRSPGWDSAILVPRLQLHLYLFPVDQLWTRHANETLRFSQANRFAFSSRLSSSPTWITQHQVCVIWNPCVYTHGHPKVTSVQIPSLAVNLKAATKHTNSLKHIWPSGWSLTQHISHKSLSLFLARDRCGARRLPNKWSANWATHLARLWIPLVLSADMPVGSGCVAGGQRESWCSTMSSPRLGAVV